MDKKSQELLLLQELVELSALECPMILVIEERTENAEATSNCPRGHGACLCKNRGQIITVSVPDEI